MNSINIIIIGARNYTSSYLEDNYITWNNPSQADHITLCKLKKNLEKKNNKVNINCIDTCYYDNVKSLDVNYIKEYFLVGDTYFLDKNAHNIIIEFANILTENHVVYADKKQQTDVLKYIDYKLSWISCGCGWDIDINERMINLIIDNNYVTPIDSNNVSSYLDAIHLKENFVMKNIEVVMAPFSQGIYQILGSLMWRGFSQDYTSENVLVELFKIFDQDNVIILRNYESILKFINKEIHWNMLPRGARLDYTIYIYGNNIKIDM